jgi:type IV secretion system protein TrbL
VHFNTLTLTLQNFIAALSGGYGRLQGSVNSLLSILVGIEVVLLGLWTALGGGDNVVGIFKKILQIGAWVWIVQAYPSLCKAFVESLVHAGLLAGGGGDASLLMDPSRLAGYGLDATEPLTKKLADLGMTDLSDLIVFGFGYLAILACFLIMAINVFLAVLEYYLFAALVGIFLPFGLLAPTKFLAEKAVGAVVSAGVKLMVLAFVTAIIDPVLSNIHFAGPEITFNELWSMFLTVCGLMFFCWKAPNLAASLLGGSPHLGAGDLLQAASTPIAAGMALGAVASRVSAPSPSMRAAAGGSQSSGPRAPSGPSAAASALGSMAANSAGAAVSSPGASSPPSSPSTSPPGASPSLVLSSMGKPGGSSPGSSPTPSVGPTPSAASGSRGNSNAPPPPSAAATSSGAPGRSAPLAGRAPTSTPRAAPSGAPSATGSLSPANAGRVPPLPPPLAPRPPEPQLPESAS